MATEFSREFFADNRIVKASLRCAHKLREKDLDRIKSEIKKLYDSNVPIFAICLGHQLTALAAGGKTYKLKYGHRGVNQPVREVNGVRTYITSQNHGYAVDENSLEGTGLIADQHNVNDGSVEGVRHRDLPIFTSQYHPEASPGPWDTSFLFDNFRKMVKEGKL